MRSGWQVHAYCLMSNHFHLVVETPRANLVAGMKWLLGTYTMRFNRRHKLAGHLFGGRYKAQLIDETDSFSASGSVLNGTKLRRLWDV
jgi:REP element-mobilizing transposase RayT